MNQPPMYHFISPVPGSILRLLLGEQKLWLQFFPSLIGVVWLLCYWTKHQKVWRWDQQISIIIFVSLLTAPYGWSWDYSLLLPAITKVTIEAFDTHRTFIINQLIFIHVSLNGIALFLRFKGIPDHFMFWYLPALFIAYKISSKQIASIQGR